MSSLSYEQCPSVNSCIHGARTIWAYLLFHDRQLSLVFLVDHKLSGGIILFGNTHLMDSQSVGDRWQQLRAHLLSHPLYLPFIGVAAFRPRRNFHIFRFQYLCYICHPPLLLEDFRFLLELEVCLVLL